MKREELIELCRAAFYHKDTDRGLPYDYNDSSFSKWAENNLASHPEPQPQEQKTAEEGFIKHFDKFRYGIFKSSLDAWIKDGRLSGSFLLAVREYASQSQSSVLPNEEDIRKEANWRFTSGHGATDEYSVEVFINAVKWFKSQLKQGYPKEFIEWFTGKDSPYAILYGDQPERFATTKKDYTIDELYQYWIDNVKDK